MKKLNKKGFTLIELLAVIVIMAILVAVAIPAVTRYLDTSRKGTFVSNAQAAIGAVRNDVMLQSFGGVKIYFLDAVEGCYTYDATATNGKRLTKAAANLQNKTSCLAGNTTTTTTYYWSDGSINELLEKKLKTSPYGGAYSDTSFVRAEYKAGTAGAAATYIYSMCLTDADGQGLAGNNGAAVTEDLISDSQVKTDLKAYCTPVAK